MSTRVSDTAELALPGGAPLAEAQAPHRWRAAVGKYLHHPAGMVGLALTLAVVVTGLLADVISPGDPFQTVDDPLLEPSGAHWMGTDNLGRDVFDAVVHGARTSMVVVIGVVVIASVIGLGVGIVAGYRGGWVGDRAERVARGDEVGQQAGHDDEQRQAQPDHARGVAQVLPDRDAPAVRRLGLGQGRAARQRQLSGIGYVGRHGRTRGR